MSRCSCPGKAPQRIPFTSPQPSQADRTFFQDAAASIGASLDEKESKKSVADMSDLLSSVIAAHGGLDRWRTVRAIDVTVQLLGWAAGSQGLSRPSPAFGFGGRC